MVRALAIIFLVLNQQSHVTMTGINFVEGTDSVKVSCRMLFEDFIRDLQTIDDDRNLRAAFSKQPFPADLINFYFNSKLSIHVNNKLLTGKLLSAEIADNEFIVQLTYKSDKKPKRITIMNLILTGWYHDQTNLTIVRINNTEHAFRFTPQHTEETIKIR